MQHDLYSFPSTPRLSVDFHVFGRLSPFPSCLWYNANIWYIIEFVGSCFISCFHFPAISIFSKMRCAKCRFFFSYKFSFFHCCYSYSVQFFSLIVLVVFFETSSYHGFLMVFITKSAFVSRL